MFRRFLKEQKQDIQKKTIRGVKAIQFTIQENNHMVVELLTGTEGNDTSFDDVIAIVFLNQKIDGEIKSGGASEAGIPNSRIEFSKGVTIKVEPDQSDLGPGRTLTIE